MVKILGQWSLIFDAKHVLVPYINFDVGIHIWQFSPWFFRCYHFFRLFAAESDNLSENAENGILDFFHEMFIWKIWFSVFIYMFCF